MPVEPVSGTLVSIILNESQKEEKKRRKSGYWMMCPSCGRKVVKKQLIKMGCYLCKWKGTEEEIKKAQARQMRLMYQSKHIKPLANANTENIHSYRKNCPKCGRAAITAQLKEKGCYLCGWKPRKILGRIEK